MSKIKKIIYALSTLSGTIIGVGLFSLPYITLKVGFWVILGYFLILGAIAVIVHMFFGELSLKTPDFKRLPGFAEIYLGKKGKTMAYISTILGLFGAILAYLLVGGEFLANLISPILGGSTLIYTVIYFILGSFLIFFGIKAICKVEFWGLVLFFIILILLFFKGKFLINTGNLFISSGEISVKNLFLPYGPILFSIWGATLIPEIEEMLGENKILIKKIIPIAILIPILVYLFFIYLILGITGNQTTESALTGLRNFLGPAIFNIGLLFGLLTTFTSFITVGLTLKKTFWYDLKVPKLAAWSLTCFLPLILFLIGIKNFIPVISFVGGIMLGIDGILILLMYRKIKTGKLCFLAGPLILIFALGIIYEIMYFFK